MNIISRYFWTGIIKIIEVVFHIQIHLQENQEQVVFCLFFLIHTQWIKAKHAGPGCSKRC